MADPTATWQDLKERSPFVAGFLSKCAADGLTAR